MNNNPLNAPPRIHKTIDVLINDQTTSIVLRRASPSLVAMALAEAMKAGDIDADNQPLGNDGAMRVLARMASLVVYLPDAVRPAYDRRSDDALEQIIASEWLLPLQKDINAALSPAGVALEQAKGNSEATPTER